MISGASIRALTATRESVAANLIAMYKALGGGWELRESNTFVPVEMSEEMCNRTDWGDLLESGATEVPAAAEAGETLESPGW